MAWGSVLMPTPSSRMVSDCSKISQARPRERSINAVVRPPIPPPTIIAFIALTPLGTHQAMRPNSHGRSLRRKRLCRLRLELGPGLGLSLNSQLLEILPVAHAVAENLIFSGKILRRAERVVRPVPGCRPHGEGGIDQMRPPERNEVSPAGSQDGVGLVRHRDVADAHRGHARLIADLVGERGLEHAAIDRLRIAHGLPGRDVDEIDARLGKNRRNPRWVSTHVETPDAVS